VLHFPSYASTQVADALAAAYESLYTNPKWLAAWGSMWGVVAAFFKDRPEIIGIELINEPFAGDLYRDPLIMVPVRIVFDMRTCIYSCVRMCALC
jgi:endoglycosylceramidase